MNASSTSLSLIPLFIFMIFLGILVIVFTRVIKPWVNGNLSWKKNSFFAGLYLALLFILVPIFYLLSTQEFAQPSEVKSQNIDHSRTDVVTVFLQRKIWIRSKVYIKTVRKPLKWIRMFFLSMRLSIEATIKFL